MNLLKKTEKRSVGTLLYIARKYDENQWLDVNPLNSYTAMLSQRYHENKRRRITHVVKEEKITNKNGTFLKVTYDNDIANPGNDLLMCLGEGFFSKIRHGKQRYNYRSKGVNRKLRWFDPGYYKVSKQLKRKSGAYCSPFVFYYKGKLWIQTGYSDKYYCNRKWYHDFILWRGRNKKQGTHSVILQQIKSKKKPEELLEEAK